MTTEPMDMMARRQDDLARPYRPLGDAVAKARAAAQLSQRDFARAIHINEGYVSLIETGRRKPSVTVLQRIAGTLPIDYDELAALAGYQKPPSGEVRVLGAGPKASALRQLAEFTAEELFLAKEFIVRWTLRVRPSLESHDHDGRGDRADDRTGEHQQ